MAEDATTAELGQTDAPPQELGLSDAPAAPQGPVEGAEQEATLQGEQPDAEQAEADGQPEEWHGGAENAEAYRETEGFKSWQADRDEERDEEREHELRTEIGRGQSRITRTWGEYQATTQAAAAEIGKVAGQLQRAMKEGTLDAEALDGLQEPLGKIGAQVQSERFWSGAASLFKELTELVDPGFFERYEHEFWDMAANPAGTDQTLKTLWGRLMRAHDKQLRTDTVTEWEKKTQTRRDGEDKDRERQAAAPPAKTAGAGGAGGKGWRTKTEARTLHVQDKITTAEMKRINADPTIPEM
jgi:hypothetical protein